MKKPSLRRRSEPAAASLIELPEIDFTAARVRRNPYASRIAREGIEVVHDEPSAGSLAAIPEIDFARASRNPYAERLARDLQALAVGRGRPRAGEEGGPTTVRSVRLPARIWEALEAEAAARKLTVHAILRAAVARFLEDSHELAEDQRRGRSRRSRR